MLAIVLATLSGCAGTSLQRSGAESDALLARMPALNAAAFAPAVVPSVDELVALDADQRRHFLRYFRSGVNARHPPHRRIHAYMVRYLDDIDFGHRTALASETIDERTGNCMSLALVTTALARIAEVDVGWQLANADPVYSSEGSVIYSANHIQVRLYEPRLATTGYAFSLGRDYLLLDYFTDGLPEHGTPLSEREMIALVYQNLGVEAMAEGRLNHAFWLLREGLQHDPGNANLYNALAVLHRRAGDEQTAEELFAFALDEFGDRLIVLRNFRKMLLAQNRDAEAGTLEQRILRLPDPDPYPILTLGDEALAEGRPQTALSYYRKARKVAPYLHEIHWKIAQVHFGLGDTKRAERELHRAERKAWAESDKRRYNAKLQALNSGR